LIFVNISIVYRHDILIENVNQKVQGLKTCSVSGRLSVHTITEQNTGLPIGNLTSPVFCQSLSRQTRSFHKTQIKNQSLCKIYG